MNSIKPSVFNSSGMHRRRNKHYKRSPLGCLFTWLFSIVVMIFVAVSPFIFLHHQAKKLIENNQTVKKVKETIDENDDEVRNGITEFFNLTKGAAEDIIESGKELSEIELDAETEEEFTNSLLEEDIAIDEYITENYNITPKIETEDTDTMFLETLANGSYLKCKYGIEIYSLWEIWEVSTDYLKEYSNSEELIYMLDVDNSHRLITYIDSKIVDEEMSENDYKNLLVNKQKRDELNKKIEKKK